MEEQNNTLRAQIAAKDELIGHLRARIKHAEDVNVDSQKVFENLKTLKSQVDRKLQATEDKLKQSGEDVRQYEDILTAKESQINELEKLVDELKV